MPDNSERWSRRDLLALAGGMALAQDAAPEAPAAGTVAPPPEAPAGIPRRKLGRTGEELPILGFGTAPSGIRRNLENGAALYEEALELGIRYFDTAPLNTCYGIAQKQLGAVLHRRRNEIFLATKCHEADGDAALRLLHRNLKELRTDHADLVHIHSLGSLEVGRVAGPHGILRALRKAKQEGLTRFVGVSGHHRTPQFLRLLEDHEVDVMMCAVNFVDAHTYGFERKVWPVAARKGIGLVAMKVFGGMVYTDPGMSNRMVPGEHLRDALRYALSAPHASLAVVGMATSEELRQNVQWAREFQPLAPEERVALTRTGRRLAAHWGAHLGPTA